jgi:hypothetical protein
MRSRSIRGNSLPLAVAFTTVTASHKLESAWAGLTGSESIAVKGVS